MSMYCATDSTSEIPLVTNFSTVSQHTVIVINPVRIPCIHNTLALKYNTEFNRTYNKSALVCNPHCSTEISQAKCPCASPTPWWRTSTSFCSLPPRLMGNDHLT